MKVLFVWGEESVEWKDYTGPMTETLWLCSPVPTSTAATRFHEAYENTVCKDKFELARLGTPDGEFRFYVHEMVELETAAEIAAQAYADSKG